MTDKTLTPQLSGMRVGVWVGVCAIESGLVLLVDPQRDWGYFGETITGTLGVLFGLESRKLLHGWRHH